LFFSQLAQFEIFSHIIIDLWSSKTPLNNPRIVNSSNIARVPRILKESVYNTHLATEFNNLIS